MKTKKDIKCKCNKCKWYESNDWQLICAYSFAFVTEISLLAHLNIFAAISGVFTSMTVLMVVLKYFREGENN
jgi:hypothetical protein